MTALPPLDTGELYRVLAESASDAIVTIDEASTILSVNPAGERLFGYAASELIGQPLQQVMPERHRAAHRAGIQRYLASGVRNIPWKGIQLPILTRDGREIPAEIAFGEFTSAGRRFFSAVLRDISERAATEASLAAGAELLRSQAMELEQQIEEAQAMGEELEQTNQELHEANALLVLARVKAEAAAAHVNEVLDSLTDAVSVFDRDWRWTYVNPGARAVLTALGHDPDAVIGNVLWERLPELLGTLFETETRRALATNSLVTYEEYLPAIDRWFENRIVPSPSGITTFTRDVSEQRLAADALRSREAEFRALANSIPTLAWMANPDGWIFWYNDRWYEYTGTGPADMEGWGWQRVHHPDALPEVLDEWTRSIRTGEPFEMTFPLLGADGSFRPFLTRVFPLRDAKGDVVRWFGTNTDVHHEHAARQAAEHAARRMRQLQSLTALLARARTVDDVAAAVVTEAAQATGAVTGMLAMRDDATEEAVMLGESGLPDTLRESYARFPLNRDTPTAECLRSGAPLFIGSREGPDGLLARYSSLRDVWDSVGRSAVASVPLMVDGRAVAAMTFTFAEPQEFSDGEREFFLTLAGQGAQAIERVGVFAAERRERQRSESIVESITDGFVTFDRDMRFTYVNERAASMFAVERDRLLGRDVTTMPHGSESPFVSLIREVLRDRQPRATEGFGTIMGRWLDMRVYPAEDGGVIAYFQDITERRAQQEERGRLLEEAQSANAAKTEFLRTVSHELRQPLNAIGGLLGLWELGLRGALSEQQQQDLERIKRNQRQLTVLIEDLLSFARLEAGKLEVSQVPVPLSSVFESLSAAIALDVETQGITFRSESVDPALRVIGDADRIHQVLVNLITNAMKATAPGGRIDLLAAAQGDMVHIHVQDTGVGIAPDKLDAIFAPFVQVGRALNQPREGAGLGLAISRGLVEAMEGTLTATSTPGQGSRFTVSLKAALS